MNKNSYCIFTGAFFALCLLLCVGVWFSLKQLYSCREEYDQLDAERHNNTGIISTLEARNASLSQITELNINRAMAVPDVVAFYGMITPIAASRRISLTSMTLSGGDSQGGKENAITLRLFANYYQFAGMLADLRNLNVPSKIISLKINRNHTLPEELIEAEMTLEVMTEE